MSKNRAMAWGRFIVTLALLGSLVATARDVIAGTTTIATLVQSTREMILKTAVNVSGRRSF